MIIQYFFFINYENSVMGMDVTIQQNNIWWYIYDDLNMKLLKLFENTLSLWNSFWMHEKFVRQLDSSILLFLIVDYNMAIQYVSDRKLLVSDHSMRMSMAIGNFKQQEGEVKFEYFSSILDSFKSSCKSNLIHYW